MSEAATSASDRMLHPFEAVLRMCAAAAPKPWYPRVYARSVGTSQDKLNDILEHLWLDGLVQKAAGTPETGPGLTLTPAGLDVLNDPAALQRLKEGRPVVQGSQGGVVREAIRRSRRPVVTWTLVGMNVAAFLYTLYLASSNKALMWAFLQTSPFGGNGGLDVTPLIEKAGGISGYGWLNGEWWRLATSCFIHIGLLHILANMYALYRVGAEVEQMWGRVRYLLIYACAGLGGSVLALAMTPRVVMAGASGALCGVIAASAVWVLCNGRHLPRALAGQMRTNLIINGVLITFISLPWLFPGISGWGHLGGALTGAAVALILQVQRFGPSPWRWAVLAALIPLAWLGYAVVAHERVTSPEWFQIAFIGRVEESTTAAVESYESRARLLETVPHRRNPERTAQYEQTLAEQRSRLQRLADDLSQVSPFQIAEKEDVRKAAVAFIAALIDLLGRAEQRLQDGAEWNADDKDAENKVKLTRRAWNDAREKWDSLPR